MSGGFEVPLHLALILQLAAADPVLLRDKPVERAPPSVTMSVAFGYTEERWLDVLQLHGGGAGQGRLAARIFRTRSGLVYVPVASDRAELAAKRQDATIVVAVTREAATANAEWLAGELGRAATTDELYVAHIATRTEALALVRAGAVDAQRIASELAPAAALAHPKLFFTDTRPKTVAEVQRQIVQGLLRAEQAHARQRSTPATTPASAWRTTTLRAAGPVTAQSDQR